MKYLAKPIKKLNVKSKTDAKVPVAVRRFWQTWAKHHVDKKLAAAKIIPLPFDASVRRYYRVQGQNLIVAYDPLLKKDQRQLLVYRVLKSFKIAVPQINFVALAQGMSLQEDVGNDALLSVIAQAQDSWPWLKKALDILIRLHQSDFSHCLESCHLKERFDQTKLMTEIDFTLEYFAQRLLQTPSAEIKALRRAWAKLCSSLVHGPWVLAHRDFHTRNIMVQRNKLVVLDYQDARWGLPQYDLASLLYDAYWNWGEKNIKHAIDYYWQHAPLIRRQFKRNKRKFIQVFYQQAAQRLFKALGTFAFQMLVRRNPRYLQYVGHTMHNLRWVLANLPAQQKLREQVAQLYYPRS